MHRLLSVILILVVFVVKRGESQVVTLSKHPVLIVISYDGFRYDYLDKTYTPNLDWVKAHGVSVPYMTNQFMTNTFPNHHSISTGLHIESHGIVANSLYDPLYGKMLSGYNDEPGFWNYSQSVIPLYALNELAGDERYSGVEMWTGSGEPYGPQNTLSTYIRKYNGSFAFEARVDEVISWITNGTKPANLVFLYFQEPDTKGHDCGPESPEIVQQIKEMDRITGYLIGKLTDLKILDKVNLIFTSDHGMQEVKQDEPEVFINLTQIIDPTKYRNTGSTPLYQLLPYNEIDTMEIYTAFKNASRYSHFSVYLKNEAKMYHPQWHYADCRRIAPILVLAEPGYTFDIYTKDGHSLEDHDQLAEPNACVGKSKGQHGYDNSVPSMWPYFMAMGPNFKANGTVEQSFSNVDIFPLVSHIMKLPDHPNNGSFARVCPLLRDVDCDDASPAPSLHEKIGIKLQGFLLVISILGIFNM